MDSPFATAYVTVAGRIADLLADRPEVAGEQVPACPKWTVGDVVRHLAGNAGAPARVLAAPGLADPLRWWADAAAEAAPEIAASGYRAGPMVLDAFTHELDLRHALGLPRPTDDLAYGLILDVATGGFAWSVTSAGLPAVVLETPESGPRQAGDGTPAATVRAARHDLLRSLTGRRTPEQIAGLQWTAAPQRWLPAFRWGPFSPPPRPAE